MIKIRHLLLAGLLVVTAPAFSLPNILLSGESYLTKLGKTTIDVKPQKIIDGDTIAFHDNSGHRHLVRLFGIDAPEKKQKFGKEATEHLKELIGDNRIGVFIYSKDKYNRIIGEIYISKGPMDSNFSGRESINAKMVADGYAWAYMDYSKRYYDLQKSAMEKKTGLWSDKNPQAPWEYRARQRAKSKKKRDDLIKAASLLNESE